MKIGFDGKRAEHNSSGLGNYSRDVIRGLCTWIPEYEYVLYSPKKGNGFDFSHERLTRTYPTARKDRLAPALWRRKGIVSDLNADQLDLFHGLSNELPFGIDTFNGVSVVTIHDLIFERYPDYYKRIDRMIYRSKTREACATADCIVAISEQTKKDLIEFYQVPADKITVVYQTCHPGFQKEVKAETVEQIRKGYQLPEDYILQVGTLEPRKNVLGSLEALALLDGANLVLIGRKTDHQKEIDQRIQDLGLGNRVKILNDVPVAFLPALYKGAQATLYPSFFEGFGIPVIESLFQSTPVVTNENGCFVEAAGAFGTYVDVHKPESIAEGVRAASRREAQNKALEEHLKQFTLEHTTRALYEVYLQVLKNR